MKTFEEAVMSVGAPNDERYRDMITDLAQSPKMTAMLLEVMGMHSLSESMRIMAGILWGVCVGIEMERP